MRRKRPDHHETRDNQHQEQGEDQDKETVHTAC
jgi:hypothetical protein